MKRIAFSVMFLLTLVQGYSQTKGISYQAVILNPDDRELPGVNAQNTILANTNVVIQFTILDASNSEEYQEYHNTTTDMYGMLNLLIGSGTSTGINDFNEIAWDGTTKILKVDIDFSAGGSQFTPLSEQFLSYMPQPLNEDVLQKIADNISGIATNASDISTIQGEQTTQNAAIALNTAKVGITAAQATILSNTSGVNTGDQDLTGLVHANRTDLDLVSGTNTGDQDISGIATNASDISTIQGEQTTQNAAIALNTAKVGITAAQATILSNTSGVNTGDQDLTGLVHANRTDLDLVSGTNTGDQDISGIATNASDISTIQGEQTTQNAAIALNTAKVGITAAQATILSNTSGVNTGDQDLTGLVHANRTDLDLVSGTNTGDQDISGIATNASDISTIQGEQTTQDAAIALNTAKVTNATHTGDVTGDGALTIASGAVDSAKIADGTIDETDLDASVNASLDLADSALQSEVDGSVTNEIQTIDTSTLSGTNLLLSLSSDGEADKSIDLSSLQDGTGTDDQTASEVSITDSGALITATDVEGALAENRTAIDLNTAKVTNATHTGDVTGDGALTIASGAVDSAKIADGTIDETDLDASVNASLDLADSALQSEVDGSVTNEIQTIDTSTLSGTNLLLSLSSDGEADKSIDLSSLQDGTGTDDQTASEVSITDSGALITATDVEGALAENRTAIDLNTAKVTNATHTGDVTGDGALTIASGAVDSAKIADGTIDETDLDASVNASLDLADSALQSEVDGSVTNEIQTIDTSTLSGTNLLLSLSSDGEADKSIDLSSLQDGTGTDDQTASEVSITDSGALITATDVEGALAENRTAIDLNTAKVTNATHTGDVTGDGALTIASGAVDSAKIADGTIDETDLDASVNASLDLADSALQSEVDGSVTNEIQTIDTSTLSGTNLLLSLSSDGEADKSIDLSSLQDGTGTDDQTASEVSITDSGALITATDVEGALAENRTAIDLNTAKVTNATHTGDVTGDGALTIASGAVDSAKIADGTIDETDLDASVNASLDLADSALQSEVDGSVTNEGSLTVTAGGANTSEIQSNTSGSSNVVIAGGTNVTVTETGNTITITSTGGSSTGSYGEIHSAPTISATTSFTAISGFTTGVSSTDVTLAGGSITIGTAGVYMITYTVSFSTSNNNVIATSSVFNGTTELTNISFERKISNGGDVGSASASGMATLSAGDVITVQMKSTIATVATLRKINLSLHKIN